MFAQIKVHFVEEKNKLEKNSLRPVSKQKHLFEV